MRLRRPDTATVLLATSWLSVVAPRVLQSLTAPKYRTYVGEGLPQTPLSAVTHLGLTVMVLGLSLIAVGRRLRDLPTDGRFLLVVALLPWMYLVGRDIYLGSRPLLASFTYPLVAIAVWATRPAIERLAVIGYLTGFTAVLSIAMAVAVPDKGIFSRATGDLIAPDKQILPWGILIGPFSDGNNLALFLVLGLPAILFIRSVRIRLLIMLPTAFALVWTSSRSSLSALVLGTGLALLLGSRKAGANQIVATVGLLIGGSVMCILPLVTNAPDAFTNRGYIWKLSFSQSESSRLFGLGSDWYSYISGYVNPLPDTAFSGHNLFVQTVVVGGIANVAVVGLLILSAGIVAVRRAGNRHPFSTVHLFALLVCGCLEVPMGFIDRPVPVPVVIIPIFMTLFAILEPPAHTASPAKTIWSKQDIDLPAALRMHMQRQPTNSAPGRPEGLL